MATLFQGLLMCLASPRQGLPEIDDGGRTKHRTHGLSFGAGVLARWIAVVFLILGPRPDGLGRP
ncbi:hypothetical protein D3260_01305 [Salinisphaera sp. Q1T1-3]|nr:hypothetical protein D3260_01305 [Salinisphaera sp. Q1T1-3]